MLDRLDDQPGIDPRLPATRRIRVDIGSSVAGHLRRVLVVYANRPGVRDIGFGACP